MEVKIYYMYVLMSNIIVTLTISILSHREHKRDRKTKQEILKCLQEIKNVLYRKYEEPDSTFPKKEEPQTKPSYVNEPHNKGRKRSPQQKNEL